MSLFRLHMKPATGSGKNPMDVVNYCTQHKVAGVGWPIDGNKDSHYLSPSEYEGLSLKKYGKRVPAIRFAWCQENDLIWSRDPDGVYYLGRVTGPYFYDPSPEVKQLDIPNQLPCHWIDLSNEEYVPGKIVASFRSPRAFQAIHDSHMLYFSQKLFNEQAGREVFNVPEHEPTAETFFKMIQSDDCEDIVGLYLQIEKGYVIIPSSNKKSTMGFEYVLKHKESGATALVQVKQGKDNLNKDYSSRPETIYLFTTEGEANAKGAGVRVLTKEVLYDFVVNNHKLLPRQIQVWL